jgi:hypothetical protein
VDHVSYILDGLSTRYADDLSSISFLDIHSNILRTIVGGYCPAIALLRIYICLGAASCRTHTHRDLNPVPFRWALSHFGITRRINWRKDLMFNVLAAQAPSRIDRLTAIRAAKAAIQSGQQQQQQQRARVVGHIRLPAGPVSTSADRVAVLMNGTGNGEAVQEELPRVVL